LSFGCNQVCLASKSRCLCSSSCDRQFLERVLPFFAKSIRMFIHRSSVQLASLLLCHYMQCSSKQRHHCPSFLLISKAANRFPHSTCIHFSLWSLRYTLYISLIYTVHMTSFIRYVNSIFIACKNYLFLSYPINGENGILTIAPNWEKLFITFNGALFMWPRLFLMYGIYILIFNNFIWSPYN